MAILAIAVPASHAEDIDIFTGGGAQNSSPPNVLVLLDNTSNGSASAQAWQKSDVSAQCAGDAACLDLVSQVFGDHASLTQGQVELASLKQVLNELACGAATPIKLNVGLMMLKPTAGAYASNSGTTLNDSGVSGFIRRAVLTLDTTRCPTLLGDLETLFNNIASSTFLADSNANYGGALFEAFKYYGGHTNPAGASAGSAGSPTGHIGFGPQRYGAPLMLEEALAFTDAPTNSSYRSPITPPQNTCGGKNYILLVGNTWPNADDTTLLPGLGYAYDAARFPYAGVSQPRLGDVWAKFLATADVSPISGQQTVQTSVMNIYNASADADQTALLKSMAKNGGGSYYEAGGNLGGLIDAFRNFFMSINAANQAFAPSALPPANPDSGTHLNQVYMGLFRPDKNPRWFGNLKLYRFAVNGADASGNPNIVLADSRNTPIQSNMGFIVDHALSFWTHSSTFWDFRCGSGSSSGDPLLCGNPLSVSDAPDGAVVEKGGANQRLRDTFTADDSNSTRTLYTGSITPFDTTLSPADFGVSTTAERDNLVNWVRGVDNIGENTSDSDGPRPSISGDVLHSRPVAVNYGATAGGCSGTDTGDVVVYYAGNDGLLHAVQGGTGSTDGMELWGFIPSEFLGNLKRLRDNSPPVAFPAPVPAGINNKPYLIDGSLSVYAPDANGDCKPDKVWLFVTLRRGGRFIYALNVTHKTSPQVLWKKSHTDYSELGQSWSELKPILLANGKPALIFGAGYDPSAEDRPFVTATGYGNPSATSRGMGRGVFVLDAETGALLKQFNAGNFSIPSDVAVVSNVNTGFAEVAYVGDTGGNLWKISLMNAGIATADTAKWSIRQMASLGDPSDLAKTGAHARTFLYPPDIVKIQGGYALLIGSGDREKPFDKIVRNRFYMIKDAGGTAVTRCEGDESSCDSDLIDATNSAMVPDTAKGWRIKLGSGEKTVGSAITQAGATHFPTHQPADISGSECSQTLGTARIYTVNNKNAAPFIPGSDRSKIIPGGGFPPSPTRAAVQLTYTHNGQPVTETHSIVHSGTHVAGIDILPTKRRFTYWYIEGLD